MKTLSETHLAHLQKMSAEEVTQKRTYFLSKLNNLLESNNCTNLNQLDKVTCVNVISKLLEN